MRPLLEQLLPILQTFILGVVSIASPLVLLWFRQRVKSRTAQLALEEIVATAATCVADAHQRIVATSKDPAKPGVWTSEVATAVKAEVLTEVRRLSAGAVTLLREGRGLDEAAVQELLGRLVEEQVVVLKARLAPAKAGVVIAS